MPIIFFKSNNSMNKKSFYTSPEVDILVVQAEGVVCQSNKRLGVMNAAGVFFNESSGNINDYTDVDF